MADHACLGERTLVGQFMRLVKDYMRTQANCQAVNVAVTPVLLRSAGSAYSKYIEFLEEEKKKEERKMKEMLICEQQLAAEEQKKGEERKKKEIMVAMKEQHNLFSGSGALLKEAETELAEAIRAGNMDNISIAHGLLEVARHRINEATKTLSKLAEK